MGVSESSITSLQRSHISSRQRTRIEVVGFYANTVCIPGLNKADAEALKNLILDKMKENPIDDNKSGL